MTNALSNYYSNQCHCFQLSISHFTSLNIHFTPRKQRLTSLTTSLPPSAPCMYTVFLPQFHSHTLGTHRIVEPLYLFMLPTKSLTRFSFSPLAPSYHFFTVPSYPLHFFSVSFIFLLLFFVSLLLNITLLESFNSHTFLFSNPFDLVFFVDSLFDQPQR